MEKDISIVITIYNKEIYLGHCFTLLNEQLLRIDRSIRNRLELLIINDCSTDNSMRLIESILDPSIEYRVIDNQERKNIAYVRWQAVNEVKGRYFIFIDADDLISEDYINILLNVDFNKNADIYQFKGREYPNGTLMGFNSTWSPLKLIKTSFTRKHDVNYNKDMPIGTEECVGGEDSDYYNRLCMYNPVIWDIDKILVTWNFAVPDSITKINYSYIHFISKE